MSKTSSPSSSTLDLAIYLRIAEECARFESAWRAGLGPRLEEFLDELGDARPVVLSELIALEVALRRELGEDPHRDEYRLRFPADDDAGRPFLSSHEGEGDGLDRGDAPTDPFPLDPDEEPGAPRPVPPVPETELSVEPPPSPEPRERAKAVPFPGVSPRYTFLRFIGRGGFGDVFLARDEELTRAVAIKVPRPDAFRTARQRDLFVKEARLAAVLKHPSIVTVHDIGHLDNGLLFVVLEYVEGGTLCDLLQSERLPIRRVVDLMIELSEVVHHAHREGLVHRDLKPANVLIDVDGRPRVTDFGLAIRDDGLSIQAGEIAGTPAYMAPEQARGETHRLDASTDVWGLGVILYEMLTGRLPFNGSRTQTLDEVLNKPPKYPRRHDESIPRELERICLNCLVKRMSDRCPSAAALAEDLRHWRAREGAGDSPFPSPVDPGPPPAAPVAASGTDQDAVEVVSKGLRSFDVRDSKFFLELLPGPRDRDGLPAGLRFWKTRIEETDPARTFCVGLIYGPSGCGKSSLMKAGILPRLAPAIVPVYVEATPSETEDRLLASLRRRCPDLPRALSLHDALASLRDGRTGPPERKVLIVIDQFEQWLHAQGGHGGPDRELVRALRQCDGGRAQCLILVRDDFWMGITRFFRDLEVKLVEGDNSAPVDLFDPAHARKVLAEFGRSFGRVPARPAKLASEQVRFLDQAIAELQHGADKVVPVRLSLFVEMVRDKPWTPATLRSVGGAEGLGVAFLEETFSAPTSPPAHRAYQDAARGVLKALLPEEGTDIKGRMRSDRELRAVSGTTGRDAEFAGLIGLLDHELRLVTPTDPEGLDPDPGARESGGPGQVYYQLAHDDLVPSIRQWLTRKQSETMHGRAEIRLAERAALWNARQDRRQLPSIWEFLGAALLTRHARWTVPERKLMGVSTRYYAIRALLLTVAAVTLLAIGNEVNGRLQATNRCAQLLNARTADVPLYIRALEPYRRWADPILRNEVQSRSGPEDRAILHARLALLPVDRNQLLFLANTLLVAEPAEFLVIRSELSPHAAALKADLWRVALDAEVTTDRRLRAGCALAAFDPADARWGRVAPEIVAKLAKEDPLRLVPWIDALRPVRRSLLPPLRSVFQDPRRPETRYVAARILAEYLADEPEALLELALMADPRQLGALLPRLRTLGDSLASPLEKRLDAPPPPDNLEKQLDVHVRVQASAGALLAEIGRGARVWPLLKWTPNPRLRSRLIHQFAPARVDPRILIARLDDQRDLSIRRALLFALGEYDPDDVPPFEREALVRSLLDRYRTDPDAGTHSATGWLLRRWGYDAERRTVDRALTSAGPVAGFGWYVNGQGHTLSLIRGPVETSTGVVLLPDGQSITARRVAIPRSFAVATKEVTREQIRRFRGLAGPGLEGRPEGERPADFVSWFEAARYCRWLSEQEHVPEKQMCYPPIVQIKEGMTLPADYLTRTGYRLPTEAEWEYACRAGSETHRYFGDEQEMLRHYAWTPLNSEEHSWPVGRLKPNDLGFFDILGNVYEWFQEAPFLRLASPESTTREIDREDLQPVSEKTPRGLRGGAYDSGFQFVRSGYLNRNSPSKLSPAIGFRVARTLD